MELFQSYDSEDTKVAISVSDGCTTEYIMDDGVIDRLSTESFSECKEILNDIGEDSFRISKPRPQSLLLKEGRNQRDYYDLILFRRENSDPVTTLEKNQCMNRAGTMNSPTGVNLISLVQFIRMKSRRSRSIRLYTCPDEESADKNADRNSSRSCSRSSTSIFNCFICLENHLLSDSCSYTGCQENHKFCKECLSSFLTLQIRDGVVMHKCPFESCHQVAQDQDIASLVDSASFEKYVRFREMKADPTYRECSVCGRQIPIPSNFFEDAVGEEVAREPTLTCSSCWNTTCFYHGDAHPRESCQDYALRIRKQEMASRKLLSRIARRCPQCKAETEKMGGCNHMTCQHCSTDWCWLCGKSLSGADKLKHYDPADLFNGCAGNQFTPAPSFAWWSIWDRYQSNENSSPSEDSRGIGNVCMRSLNSVLQVGYAVLNVTLTCLLLCIVSIVFCSVAALMSVAVVPIYLFAHPIFQLHRSGLRASAVYASCMSLVASRCPPNDHGCWLCSAELAQVDVLAEVNLHHAFIDAVQLVAYLAALAALAPLQLLWLPWALLWLLLDMALQRSLGIEIPRELVFGRLFLPSVKVVSFFQRFFDDDGDELQ